MKQCNSCQNVFADAANKCPNCGSVDFTILETKAAKSSQSSTAVKIIAAILAVLLLGSLYFNFQSLKTPVAEQIPVATEDPKREAVVLNFGKIGQLATQTAYYTMVDKIDNNQNLFNTDIRLIKSEVIYSYDGVIKAGFDFGQIKHTVDEENKIIEVTFPPVKILSNQLDETSFKLWDDEENALRPISLQEKNDSAAELKNKAEQDAIEKGLFENAKDNAALLITNFLLTDYPDYTYEITFEEET